MRIKQTARKSTASRDTDPLRQRMGRLLETKRNSAGNARPTPGQSSSHGRYSLPVPTRGKHITFSPRSTEGVKIKPKMKPGQLALKEIQSLQKSWDLQIPRAAFHRLIREITQGLYQEEDTMCDVRYQAAALEALQEAAESYLIGVFEDSYLCTVHAKRVTLFPRDMELCRKLRRSY